MEPIGDGARRGEPLRAARVRAAVVATALALAATVPAASAAVFSLPVDVSPAGQDIVHFSLALAVDPQGTTTVLWTFAPSTGNAGRFVEGRRVAADGGQGPVLVLSDTTTDDNYQLSAAADAQGNVTGTWARESDPLQPTTSDIPEARRIGVDGSLSPVRSLDPFDGESFAVDPGPVAIDAQGTATVVWVDNSVAQTRRITPGGALTSINDLGGGDAEHLNLGLDANGNATVVWLSSLGLRMRRIAADGSLPLAAQDVATVGGVEPAQQLAVDPQGNAVVAWVQGGPASVQARRIRADGTMSAPQTISTTGLDSNAPAVAFDPAGNAIVVWVDAGPPTTINMRRLAPDGTSLTAPQVLSDPTRPASGPQVAVDGQGNAIVAWLGSDGSNSIVQARQIDPGGGLSAIQTLSLGGYNAGGPALAVGPGGDATVAWQRFNGVNAIVQVARIVVPRAGSTSSPPPSPAGPGPGLGPRAPLCAVQQSSVRTGERRRARLSVLCDADALISLALDGTVGRRGNEGSPASRRTGAVSLGSWSARAQANRPLPLDFELSRKNLRRLRRARRFSLTATLTARHPAGAPTATTRQPFSLRPPKQKRG